MSDDKADNVMTPEELVAYYRECSVRGGEFPIGISHGIEAAVKTLYREWKRWTMEPFNNPGPTLGSVLNKLQREINGGGEG